VTLSCASSAKGSNRRRLTIKEMLGLSEGSWQDRHNAHSEVAMLITRIESAGSREGNILFEEMTTKLPGDACRAAGSLPAARRKPKGGTRNFAGAGANASDPCAAAAANDGRE
jgi:hypothetical protein